MGATLDVLVGSFQTKVWKEGSEVHSSPEKEHRKALLHKWPLGSP